MDPREDLANATEDELFTATQSAAYMLSVIASDLAALTMPQQTRDRVLQKTGCGKSPDEQLKLKWEIEQALLTAAKNYELTHALYFDKIRASLRDD